MSSRNAFDFYDKPRPQTFFVTTRDWVDVNQLRGLATFRFAGDDWVGVEQTFRRPLPLRFGVDIGFADNATHVRALCAFVRSAHDLILSSASERFVLTTFGGDILSAALEAECARGPAGTLSPFRREFLRLARSPKLGRWYVAREPEARFATTLRKIRTVPCPPRSLKTILSRTNATKKTLLVAFRGRHSWLASWPPEASRSVAKHDLATIAAAQFFATDKDDEDLWAALALGAIPVVQSKKLAKALSGLPFVLAASQLHPTDLLRRREKLLATQASFDFDRLTTSYWHHDYDRALYDNATSQQQQLQQHRRPKRLGATTTTTTFGGEGGGDTKILARLADDDPEGGLDSIAASLVAGGLLGHAAPPPR